MTTTDALQLTAHYCAAEEFEQEPFIYCQQADKLGVFRPIFLNRVCDGRID